MMLPWQKRPLALNSPRDLPGLALWLDSKDVSSLRNDAGAQPVTTDGIKLASDKSGNSSTNVLCLNGVAGNNATVANAAYLQILTGIRITVQAALDNWSTVNQYFVSKRAGATGEYFFRISSSNAGRLMLSWYNGSTQYTAESTTTVPFSNFSTGFVRATKSAASGGNVTVRFYTSSDGVTYSQLGSDVAVAALDATTTTNVLYFGAEISAGAHTAGRIYSAVIENGYDGAGSVVLSPNFATAAKLATSFTESSSNAATVTINTSGATGARISGARDLYQGTAANRPILTIAAAGNYLTFDGSNDYLKAAAFSLSQPETVYFVGSQVSWTLNDNFYDGDTSSNRMTLAQAPSTPQLQLFAGTSLAAAVSIATGTSFVSTAVYNGASSANRINRSAAVTGSPGTQSANGFTLASSANGTLGANITAQEVLVYSGAHDKATQDRVIAYLANRNRIALT